MEDLEAALRVASLVTTAGTALSNKAEAGASMGLAEVQSHLCLYRTCKGHAGQRRGTSRALMDAWQPLMSWWQYTLRSTHNRTGLRYLMCCAMTYCKTPNFVLTHIVWWLNAHGCFVQEHLEDGGPLGSFHPSRGMAAWTGVPP